MGMIEHADRVLDRLRRGLPLVARPYAAIADELGIGEEAVLAVLRHLDEVGAVGRFGVIVDHQTLGYTANAMVVWDVPAEAIDEVGRRIARCGGVSLCYRRTPRPPLWPYALYTMIHGRSRDEVTARVDAIAARCGLNGVERQLLFTVRRFKQTAACYGRRTTAPTKNARGGE
ncbi:AsnC family protein [Azospirillum sp. YIM DDC1]|uniref:siroheme decarboxylase n=2 Tax=Azospirillum aestuarii TaxID=2802052 RepID=A0ABS1I7N7_9PROT|nr:AsnC family protein [Azospirillum aestuarii]MBK4722981.1 AsnC family protein [Azospirillum aestuarii]